MKPILTLFLVATLFTTIYSDITGTYLSDWQNSRPVLICGPLNFAISTNTSGTYIAYNFTNETLTHCNLNVSTDFSSVLTENPTNVWTDSSGQELLYDTATQTITYPAPAGSLQTQYLYDKTGAYLAQATFGSIMYGVWSQPARVDTGNTNQCACVPDIINFGYSDFSDDGFSAAYSYPQGPCGGIDNFSEMDAWILTPSTGTITWNLTDPQGTQYSHITFDFANTQYPNSFTLILQPATNSCVYSYQKTSTLLNGTWQIDWQTPAVSGYPTSIELTTTNNLYMTASYAFPNGTDYLAYISFQTSAPSFAAYYDPNLDLILTYLPSDNALTISPPSPLSSKLIYSVNGSLFSTAPFVNTWLNESIPTGSACCYPYQLQLTSNSSDPHTVNAVYLFSAAVSGYCSPAYVQNNTAQTTFKLEQPSTDTLYLIDELGSTISFATPEDTTLLLLPSSGISCAINMVSTNPPGPKGSQMMSVSLILISCIISILI